MMTLLVPPPSSNSRESKILQVKVSESKWTLTQFFVLEHRDAHTILVAMLLFTSIACPCECGSQI
ncbi:hypothetical protein DPMN_136606 [Dreissena polymorpha]|uniref:Uncharacterized protein n=1 Tax=Dreissena polymorpha TaxID=45954 RepID=A0A9D4G0C6_DREPO|nr:hypothetical protein DPMN_136606 [Dreissena polymorpha]